jgi:hypothetical protein
MISLCKLCHIVSWNFCYIVGRIEYSTHSQVLWEDIAGIRHSSIICRQGIVWVGGNVRWQGGSGDVLKKESYSKLKQKVQTFL